MPTFGGCPWPAPRARWALLASPRVRWCTQAGPRLVAVPAAGAEVPSAADVMTTAAVGAQPEPRTAPAALFKDQNDTWVDRHAPAALRPYLKLTRVDRPIGTYLVLLPGLWGLALAAPAGALPDPFLSALFVAGAFTMRSAGCTMNDMWDRNFDGQVARTAQRPLAARRLTMLQAWTFLGAQLSLGLGILLQLNWPTIVLGVASVPIVAIYPALKRVTHLPQVVLGTAMNYGVLMGFSAVHGAVDWAVALPLYVGAVGWTVIYDTIYAHQDKADDARLGLRSTALLMADATRPVLTALTAGVGGCWVAAGIVSGLAWPYFLGVAASVGHLLWQVRTADYGDRLSLARRFVANQWVGWLMLAGIVGGKLLLAGGADWPPSDGAPGQAGSTATGAPPRAEATVPIS
jgi:4-hydroxybenzoate polyprenyltransferase